MGKSALYFLLELLNILRTLRAHLLPPSCRFFPSCSEYTLQALEYKGVFRGTFYALSRLLRCHPFHPGGWDPVQR